MASIIFLICAVTALICCMLLLKGHSHSRAPLLFWSGLCFAGLAINNLILFANQVLFPAADLTIYDRPAALVSILLLLYGMIWKTKGTV